MGYTFTKADSSVNSQADTLPSGEEKDKWRKTLTPKDLEVLREIKRVFPDSELVQITFEG